MSDVFIENNGTKTKVNIWTNDFKVSSMWIDEDNDFCCVSEYDLTSEEKSRLEEICKNYISSIK